MSEVGPEVYVGCSLTHAPEEFKISVEGLKQVLREDRGYQVSDFLGLVEGTANDVYRWDIHKCVAECDFFLGICDYQSTGLGYELGAAVEKYHKPTLAVAHENAHVTRLVQGVDSLNYKFRRYKDMMEIPDYVAEMFEELETARDHQV